MQSSIRTTLLAAALAPVATAQLPTRQIIDSPDNSPAFAVEATAVGDVDGDGVTDFAVSETTITPFTPPDQVHLFSGATGALLFSWTEPENDDEFGQAIAGIGDVDGDQIGDLLIGSPGDDENGDKAGRIQIFSGATGALLFEDLGVDFLDAHGRYVAAAGDVNGDGVPDYLVTASGEDQPTISAWGGITRLYSGADGTVLAQYDNSSTSNDPSDQYGDALAGAGDLDGDGVRDVLVAAPGRLFSGIGRRGVVEGRSGADGSILFELKDLSFPGENQAFGRAVAGGVDLNGDGVGEILVGATGDDEGGLNVGAAFVYDGATRALIVKHLGVEDGNGDLGRRVAFVGDVNGDGAQDYAAVYAYGGTVGFSGYVNVWSGADHTLLDTLETGESSDGFGSCIAALGDVDGDLLPDILVGARQDRQVRVMSVAGTREYGAVPAEVTQSVDLSWVPTGGADPARGTLTVEGGPSGAFALFAVSEGHALDLFLGATLLIDLADPSLVLADIVLDGAGSWASPETTLRQPALEGVNLFCQILAVDPGSPLGFVTSAGLDLRLTD